ncbi:hypothetical protein P1X15_10950 [Runella sp. MFBS21]|uniref:hypothetical protein n=1 Tax=Runella TaxID=105 RepID=UPI0012F7BBD2|nr:MULTISPECIES: hypothetical protein [Runella]MDF7818118.1 hypothetical protein [Runella sp. MFBS21]
MLPTASTLSLDNSWMFKEVNEKFLTRNEIYGDHYARHKMAYIRKTLNLKQITIRTFAEFYRIDVWLFYGKK